MTTDQAQPERMSAQDRAQTLLYERLNVDYAQPDAGRASIEAIIAATIEECRRHAPVLRGGHWWCHGCVRWTGVDGCDAYRRLSAPLLAAGVPDAAGLRCAPDTSERL